jgi:hypothetical protein
MRVDNPYADCGGRWYRGALHVHAGEDAAERAQAFRDRRFDFACFTRPPGASERGKVDLRDFLVIDGLEIGHPSATILGNRQPLPAKVEAFPLRRALEFARGQKAFAIVNHPMVSALDPDTLLDADGAGAIEIFSWKNSEQTNACADQLWDLLLRRGRRLWGVAADHSQGPMQAGRGWVTVNAPLLAEEPILDALRKGRFYASTGPYIHEVEATETVIRVRCSPAERIEFITGSGDGIAFVPLMRKLLDGAVFRLVEDGVPRRTGGYVRIEIHGSEGSRAWTNPIFTGDGPEGPTP